MQTGGVEQVADVVVTDDGLAFNPLPSAGVRGQRATLTIQLDDDELPDGQAFADCNAMVAWSAASQVVVSSQVRMRRNSYPGDTGESINLQFRGAPGNFIVVQPYEI